MTDCIQIGIDIGGTKMLQIAIEGAEIRSRDLISTGRNFSGIDAEAEIDRFIRSLPVDRSRCHRIGIAVPGLVDENKMVIACDVLPALVGWMPSAALQSICPVHVCNDAEAALVRVMKDFPHSVVAVVMVGTGIGAAMAIDGQIFRGANGWAGELGSIPIDIHGSTLDDRASGAAILQQLDIDADRLQLLVEDRDPISLQTIERAGSALGLGLATFINLFNPAAIVLSGGTLHWHGYLAAALRSTERCALPDLWAACKIQLSPHDGDLVALGAARYQKL